MGRNILIIERKMSVAPMLDWNLFCFEDAEGVHLDGRDAGDDEGNEGAPFRQRHRPAPSDQSGWETSRRGNRTADRRLPADLGGLTSVVHSWYNDAINEPCGTE